MGHKQDPADDREFAKCSHSRNYSTQARRYESPSELQKENNEAILHYIKFWISGCSTYKVWDIFRKS